MMGAILGTVAMGLAATILAVAARGLAQPRLRQAAWADSAASAVAVLVTTLTAFGFGGILKYGLESADVVAGSVAGTALAAFGVATFPLAWRLAAGRFAMVAGASPDAPATNPANDDRHGPHRRSA